MTEAAPKRKKYGGRKAGTPNKRTLARQEMIDKAIDDGKTPLEFLIGVYRNPKRPMAERIDAAKAAAPYVHPRLSKIEHGGADGGPIPVQFTDMDRRLV